MFAGACGAPRGPAACRRPEMPARRQSLVHGGVPAPPPGHPPGTQVGQAMDGVCQLFEKRLKAPPAACSMHTSPPGSPRPRQRFVYALARSVIPLPPSRAADRRRILGGLPQEMNPQLRDITYDISDLYTYIDLLPDLSALVYAAGAPPAARCVKRAAGQRGPGTLPRPRAVCRRWRVGAPPPRGAARRSGGAARVSALGRRADRTRLPAGTRLGLNPSGRCAVAQSLMPTCHATRRG